VLTQTQRLTIIETKVLKQLIRDIIEPERDLGHSDRKGHKIEAKEETNASNDTASVAKMESNNAAITEERGAKTSITAALQLREDARKPCEDCQ
jgi:hypothetical protein